MTPWGTLPGETPIDPSGMKVKGIVNRGQLNKAEAANIRKAVVKYLGGRLRRRTAPFDFSWSLKLHKEMLGDVWEWAGQLRTSDVNIGPSWHQVEVQLYRLFDDLALWESQDVDLLEQSIMLHHRAVEIHPFQNGNGRWSRMLANVWLKLHGRDPTDWPNEIGGVSEVRGEYLAAMKSADEGDYGPLTDLTKRFTPSPS